MGLVDILNDTDKGGRDQRSSGWGLGGFQLAPDAHYIEWPVPFPVPRWSRIRYALLFYSIWLVFLMLKQVFSCRNSMLRRVQKG
jgi:hypothetical protein